MANSTCTYKHSAFSNTCDDTIEGPASFVSIVRGDAPSFKWAYALRITLRENLHFHVHGLGTDTRYDSVAHSLGYHIYTNSYTRTLRIQYCVTSKRFRAKTLFPRTAKILPAATQSRLIVNRGRLTTFILVHGTTQNRRLRLRKQP